MNPLIQVSMFIIQSFASIYLCIILLRFILQIARADFYNPVSQFIVKATNPVLMRLRRFIPGLGGIDIAGLVFAVAFHIIIFYVLVFITSIPIATPLNALLWSALVVALYVIRIFLIAMLISAISSFIAPHSSHPILMLMRQLIEPVTSPFRRLIPPTGGFDLSFLVASIILYAVNMLLLGILHSFATRNDIDLMLIPARLFFN